MTRRDQVVVIGALAAAAFAIAWGLVKKRRSTRRDVKVLIFDIDDTLYPVTNGFTAHRNADVALKFMVERLGFASKEEAAAVRNHFFQKYHSTIKALTVLALEGQLPPMPDGSPREFNGEELSTYWAEACDFDKYFPSPDPALVAVMRSLKNDVSGLDIVAFTNGPRKYALRLLKALGLDEFFPPDMVFAVDDVMPHCKPEAAAFDKVLSGMRAKTGDCELAYSNCIMFEDSMKNVRAAKALGMGTCLILAKEGTHDSNNLADAGESSDPAVDVTLSLANEMNEKIPFLWQRQWVD